MWRGERDGRKLPLLKIVFLIAMKQLIPFVSWIENFIGGFSIWCFFPLFNLPLKGHLTVYGILSCIPKSVEISIIERYRFHIRWIFWQSDYQYLITIHRYRKCLSSEGAGIRKHREMGFWGKTQVEHTAVFFFCQVSAILWWHFKVDQLYTNTEK